MPNKIKLETLNDLWKRAHERRQELIGEIAYLKEKIRNEEEWIEKVKELGDRDGFEYDKAKEEWRLKEDNK